MNSDQIEGRVEAVDDHIMEQVPTLANDFHHLQHEDQGSSRRHVLLNQLPSPYLKLGSIAPLPGGQSHVE